MPLEEVSAVLHGVLHGPCLSYAVHSSLLILYHTTASPLGLFLFAVPGVGGQQALKEGTGFLPLTPKVTYCKTIPQKTEEAMSDK